MFHRLALSCLMLLSSTALALACSCGPTEFSYAFDTATDIFIGKAVQLELEHSQVTLLILE